MTRLMLWLCAAAAAFWTFAASVSGCSFLATNVVDFKEPYVSYYMRLRGPDLTTDIRISGVRFVHHLLAMTGEPTPQPLTDGANREIVALFNGEIYNFADFGADLKSDGPAVSTMCNDD